MDGMINLICNYSALNYLLVTKVLKLGIKGIVQSSIFISLKTPYSYCLQILFFIIHFPFLNDKWPS